MKNSLEQRYHPCLITNVSRLAGRIVCEAYCRELSAPEHSLVQSSISYALNLNVSYTNVPPLSDQTKGNRNNMGNLICDGIRVLCLYI